MRSTSIARKSLFAGLTASLLATCSLLAMPGSSNQRAQAAEEDLSSKVINIGLLLPLSSAAAESGQNILNGMNLYMDQIHHKMGGKLVHFVVENTESSPATAVQKVHKLIEQDKVPLLAGTYLSSELYAVAPVVDQKQEPLVVVSAGADNITQRQRSKWIIRTCYTGSMMAHPLAEYCYKTLGLRKIVTLANDYAYGYEVVGGFQQTFEEMGGKVVQKLWAPLGFKDFTEMTKSIRKDADAVFMAQVGQSAEIIPAQYREFGPKLPIVGNHAAFDESILSKIGQYVVDAPSVSLYTTSLDTPANKKFVKAYREKYGVDPSFYAENGYVAAMWIHKAIDSLHGNVSDKDKLTAALHSVEVKDAPRGPIKLDEYGQAVCNVYVRKVTKSGDKYTNKVVHTFPMVSQFWTYKPDEYMKQPAYAKDVPPCTHCAK